MRRWLLAALALVLLATAGWGYWERLNKTRLAYALEANYQREFYDVVGQVEQVEVLLAKSLAAGSPRQRVLYLTEVWSRASDAQSSLAQLPFKDVNLSASRKFLAQVGDYSHSLARSIAGGGGLSADQLAQLSRLHTEVGQFSRELHDTEAKMARGGFRWIDSWTKQPTRVALAEGGMLDGFVNTEKRMEEMPNLVYDGPFSDHLERRVPQGLQGPNVTKDEAVKTAREFIDVPEQANYRVTSTGVASGPIPAWQVWFQGPDNEGVTVDVSKQGNRVVWLLDSRVVGQPQLRGDQALERAQEFLKARGYDTMVPTYSIRQQNSQVIVFADKQGDVLIYPDQVKVKVALDTGRVNGFDAVPYLMAHHERQLPAPRIKEQEVRRKVNPSLKVERVRPALIPLDGGKEVLTYEVKAMLGNDPFLVYINALTGEEEQILKVVELPGGQLVM
ncbi:hypothetical protein SY88_19325 [Clostridiales bacterium PH28_bin88]|nr:hypothetical protein SY88_19325 [Clostridiales bacterium PH28_bin88]